MCHRNFGKMKIKKFLLLFFINIITIVFLILFADLIYVYYQNNSKIIQNKFMLLSQTEFFNESKSRDEDSGICMPTHPEKHQRPVVISGCSIAFGSFLPFEETIGSVISKLTDRKVYNRGRCGSCISHVLYEITETKEYDKMENPEFMFFIYDPCLHAARINAYTFSPNDQIEYLSYKIAKKGEVCRSENYKIPILFSLSFVRYFMFKKRFEQRFNTENIKLTIALFDKVNQEIHKKFPDIKFIVLLYEGNLLEKDENNKFYNEIIQGIKNQGIEVISINKIINDNSNNPKYKSDEYHPNGIIWEKTAPYLINKYHL